MTANTRTLFSVLLMQFWALTTLAQKLIFSQPGVQQGLPATEAYNLFPDGRVYVWVFTECGIVRHNGTRFVPACTNLPSGESVICRVIELPADILCTAIIDNGVGRKRRSPDLPTGYADRESKGTRLMVNRIENLSRLHAANGAQLELKDLTDEHGSPAGTQVTIFFTGNAKHAIR